MNCRKAQKCIQFEIDGELPADLRGPFARHLDECAPCRRIRAHMRLMTDTLSGFAAPTRAGPSLRFNRDVDPMQRWRIPLAAVAAIAALLTGWMVVNQRHVPLTPVRVANAPRSGTNVPAPATGKPSEPLALGANAEPPKVRVLIAPESNVIALPVETRNPNITILRIYPRLQLAESAGTPGAGGT